MDPAADNGGKSQAWNDLGYDLEAGRATSAANVVRQVREQLPDAEPYQRRNVEWGERWKTQATITGPNGRCGTLVCQWQYDTGSATPKMITHWLKVHAEKGER